MHPTPAPYGESDELARMREQFPGFRIWREITGERVRYVARRLRAGLNPHTVVTADVAELHAALEPSRDAGDQRPTGLLPPTEGVARHLGTIAAELTAHGLTTHLTDSRAGLDLTATLSPSGKREAEIIIDEDGYAELRYWNPPDAQPAQVTATAIRALRAVTAGYEVTELGGEAAEG